jgi:hypothetical protein
MQDVPPLGVPHELDEILELLPPRVSLNVPESVLAEWFCTVPGDGRVNDTVLKRADVYARTCGCRFGYHASIREGVFYRHM